MLFGFPRTEARMNSEEFCKNSQIFLSGQNFLAIIFDNLTLEKVIPVRIFGCTWLCLGLPPSINGMMPCGRINQNLAYQTGATTYHIPHIRQGYHRAVLIESVPAERGLLLADGGPTVGEDFLLRGLWTHQTKFCRYLSSGKR